MFVSPLPLLCLLRLRFPAASVFCRWEEGLKIFVDMVKASEEPWDPDMGHPRPPTPDATTYGAIITACSRGRQWQMALRFLDDMEKKVMALLVLCSMWS